MNVFLDEQAQRIMKSNKFPQNSGGIFFDSKQNKFIWWKNGSDFDCGECDSFDQSYKIIKK